MNREDALLHWVWLAGALGPGGVHVRDVLDAFGTPQALYEARFSQDLSALLSPGQLHAVQHTQPQSAARVLARCGQLGVHIATWDDEEYPASLRLMEDPPPVVYYKGDISVLQPDVFTFAIIGARRPSAYGLEATSAIAKGLAEAGVVLVSGLASGLDSEAHKAAVRAGTPTVACIAFGHDLCYPAANRTLKGLIEKQGLVLGEYPPGTEPLRPYFLQRNRLIAALSRGVCVAEARRVSGTMNTVHAALGYGKDVFAVPGSIFSPLSEGANHLLGRGALAAVSAADILEFYGAVPQGGATRGHDAGVPQAGGPPAQPLSQAALAAQKALGCTPKTLAQLCAESGLAPPAAMAALTELELAGACRQLAGRRFVLAP